MSKTQQLILTLLPLFIFLAFSTARADTAEDSGIWIAAFGQGSLDIISPKLQKYRWWFDAHARYLDDGNHFHQGIVRPGIGYTLMDNTAVWLGYAWITTSPEGKKDFHEHRIWQQLTWSTRLDPVTLSTRSRLEQRFLETGDDTGWRFRQLLKLVYPFSFEPRFSLVGYDEIFINLNSTDWGADSGFDQNRLFAGFGWNFDTDRRITAEIGYLNQFIRKPSGDDEMNHILSINLLLNF